LKTPKINNYFRNKIINMDEDDKDALMPIAKRAVYLTEIGISSDEELAKYIFLAKEAGRMNVRISRSEASDLIKNSVDAGDILYKLLRNKISSSKLKKIAYPNPGLSPDNMSEEVDLNKWLDIVHKIYKDCRNNVRTKESALDFYSNNLDREEKQKFLRWFDFFSSGQHLKYSSNKEEQMKKESIFQSGLVGNGFYTQESNGYNASGKSGGNNMPGDSFASSSLPDKGEVSLDSDKPNKDWKKYVNRALIRIYNLLLQDPSIDNFDEMAKPLFELTRIVKNSASKETVSDVTYKTASIFKRAGHNDHADFLYKVSQEIEQAEPLQEAEQAPPQAAPPEAAQEVPGGPSQQEAKSGVEVPEPDAVEPVKLRDIEPIPGPKEGEYDGIVGNVNLEDAAKKLDEVAGMLADRRIIRQLAEFDIMLDKIGIASMFPELAESQSKLIDAFSYALTRVTKMMGQLSNAKTLLEAGGPVPGVSAESAAPEPEQAEEILPE